MHRKGQSFDMDNAQENFVGLRAPKIVVNLGQIIGVNAKNAKTRTRAFALHEIRVHVNRCKTSIELEWENDGSVIHTMIDYAT